MESYLMAEYINLGNAYLNIRDLLLLRVRGL